MLWFDPKGNQFSQNGFLCENLFPERHSVPNLLDSDANWARNSVLRTLP